MISFEVLRLGASCLAVTYVIGLFWVRWNMDQDFIDWLLQRQTRNSILYKVLGAECVVTILGAMWVA